MMGLLSCQLTRRDQESRSHDSPHLREELHGPLVTAEGL